MTEQNAERIDWIEHPSGDVLCAICLDPAVAVRLQQLTQQWGRNTLSETISDLILVGLISINRNSNY